MKRTELKEVLFIYFNQRCHAKIVDKLSVEPTSRNFIGRYQIGKSVYSVYNTHGIWFNQFGFEAVKEER